MRKISFTTSFAIRSYVKALKKIADSLACALAFAWVFLGIANSASAEPPTITHYVLIGRYATFDEAQATAVKAAQAGLNSASVTTATAQSALPFNVTLGSFSSIRAALPVLQDVKAKGFMGADIHGDPDDPAALKAVLSGQDSAQTYFSDPQAVVYTRVEDVPLSADLAAQRTQVLALPTTATDAISQMLALADAIPEGHPAKANLRTAASQRYLETTNPYAYSTTAPAELESFRDLLLTNANGLIPAAKRDIFDSKRLTARILHYYDRNLPAALVAYNQILREADTSLDKRWPAMMRMEIAATAFELSKECGLDMSDLATRLGELWNQNTAAQQAMDQTTPTLTWAIRWPTARIGLMLTEVQMTQRAWPQAKAIADEIINTYGDYKECEGETAEAYCHEAHIAVEMGDHDGCTSATDAAIRIGEKHGKPVWGDRNVDPIWKAYMWKNAAAYKFKESQEYRDALKVEIKNRFPDRLADLKKYFGDN